MFNQLARDAGWVIDWSQIPGDVFAHARTLAIVEDHTGIDALVRPNLYGSDVGCVDSGFSSRRECDAAYINGSSQMRV